MQDIYKFYQVNLIYYVYSIQIITEIKVFQVELNSDDVKAISVNGQIKKTDFIEYALETKLLDLTDTSNARKTVNNKTLQQKRHSVVRKKVNFSSILTEMNLFV